MDDLAGHRVFFCELRLGKAPQVTDDQKGVCIDRISMEQIELHEADDLTESRYVGRQNAAEIHGLECPVDAGLVLPNRHEQLLRLRVFAETLVDDAEVGPKLPGRSGAGAQQFGVLRQKQEHFEDGCWRAHEYLRIDSFQQMSPDAESGIDRNDAVIRMRVECLAKVLENQLVEAFDFDGGTEVPLHEPFDGKVAVLLALIAEL